MNGLTTPSHANLSEFLPEFAHLRRSAVRLHPRRAAVDVYASSIGGPHMADVDDVWPTCFADHVLPTSPDAFADAPVATVPAVQLWKRDVPQLPYPAGADICQIRWCPLEHRADYGPLLYGRWINSGDLQASDRANADSGSRIAYDNFVPAACTVSPEIVDDYPMDVSEETYLAVATWMRAQGERPELYGFMYNAPGTKVGGWPKWSGRTLTRRCRHGHDMDVMMTVASDEYDLHSQVPWQPIEEQGTDIGRMDVDLIIGDLGQCSSSYVLPARTGP